MTSTPGGCRDLRKYMDDPKTQEIFGMIISGKKGYVPVVERRVEVVLCPGCRRQMAEEEKFCPECGTKRPVSEKKEN